MVYLLWLFTYIGNMAVWLQCVSVCPIMVFHNILHICSITLHNWRILNFKIYLVFGVWGKESWACVLKHFIYHYLLVLTNYTLFHWFNSLSRATNWWCFACNFGYSVRAKEERKIAFVSKFHYIVSWRLHPFKSERSLDHICWSYYMLALC